MISNKDAAMLADPGRTWACLVCGKEYKYVKALKTHIKKHHPEFHNISRKELEERALKMPMESVVPVEAPEGPVEPVGDGPPMEEGPEVQERPEVEQEPMPAPKDLTVPTELQKKFPFAEKWADLEAEDRARIQAAVEKIRPESRLTDVLDFRFADELVILVLESGQKYKIDTTQS